MNNFNYQGLSSSASSINNPTESSSFSDTSVTAGRSPNSDTELTEVVQLSSSKPKKRAGRRVFKETRHPVYSGVRHRNNNKWVCEVREPNKKSRIWLGTYPTAEMAARAHDVAALALRGKQAFLNFADSTWRLPVPASSDQLDIRRAAAEAAEGFRPEEFGGVSSSCDDDESSSREEVNENVPIIEEIKATNYGMYEDEESMFNMPRLLNSMAEGLLLSPPCYYMDTAINWDADDDVESYSGFSLWS